MKLAETESREHREIFQFSIFAENKVGCLNAILKKLQEKGIAILALTCVDQTDCAVLRIVPSYPEAAEEALKSAGMEFSKSPVLAVKLTQNCDLTKITQSLAQTEINIHYLYPFLCRPDCGSALVLSCDSPYLATSVLSGFGVQILSLDDIAR